MKKGKLKRWMSKFGEFFRRLSVEPIIVLVYFGYVFGNTVQSPQIYRRICEIYYLNDPNVNCYNINNNTVEDIVQQRSAEWTLYNSLSYLVPAIFADTLLGAFGDRNGRKINILLGITGLLVSEYGYLLTLSTSAATPYWSTTVLGLVTGFTGYVAMIPVSCYAYLADISNGPSELTLRSGIFSVLQTTASVLGGLLAGLIHDHIGISTAIDIELAFIALGFVYTLARIPQIPGLQEIERRLRVTTVTSASSVKKLRGFLGDVISLYKECIHTYRRHRVGHRRAFMFISVIVLMLTYTTQVETRTTGIGSVINNFVFRRTENGALGWDSEDLGYWNGMGYLMLIFGTLLGLIIFKKVLDFRETTLILIGIVSSTLRTIIIGVAVNDWMMYMANVVGMFAGLVQPAVVSFMTQVVASSEIGRTLALFGIGADAAFIITAALYTNVYRWTVTWMPGFTFLLIAALQTMAFLAMLWVHFQAIKEEIGKEEDMPNIRQAISKIGEESSMSVQEGRNGYGRPQIKVSNSSRGLGMPFGNQRKQFGLRDSPEMMASPMARRRDEALWSSIDDVSALRRNSKVFY